MDKLTTFTLLVSALLVATVAAKPFEDDDEDNNVIAEMHNMIKEIHSHLLSDEKEDKSESKDKEEHKSKKEKSEKGKKRNRRSITDSLVDASQSIVKGAIDKAEKINDAVDVAQGQAMAI